MKKILTATAIALTAIGVAMRARVKNHKESQWNTIKNGVRIDGVQLQGKLCIPGAIVE